VLVLREPFHYDRCIGRRPSHAPRDCPNCDGSGYTTDASGERVICLVCDGTGSLFDDEDISDAASDARS
jgi:hypothetical protein